MSELEANAASMPRHGFEPRRVSYSQYPGENEGYPLPMFTTPMKIANALGENSNANGSRGRKAKNNYERQQLTTTRKNNKYRRTIMTNDSSQLQQGRTTNDEQKKEQSCVHSLHSNSDRCYTSRRSRCASASSSLPMGFMNKSVRNKMDM